MSDESKESDSAADAPVTSDLNAGKHVVHRPKPPRGKSKFPPKDSGCGTEAKAGEGSDDRPDAPGATPPTDGAVDGSIEAGKSVVHRPRPPRGKSKRK